MSQADAFYVKFDNRISAAKLIIFPKFYSRNFSKFKISSEVKWLLTFRTFQNFLELFLEITIFLL